MKGATLNSVAQKQSFIWVSIILAVVLFFAVMSLLMMDSGAEKDTILYAKFLRVDDVR
jgi:bacteriorhodopsin